MAGGQAEQEVINSAEVYNPELNQWEHMVARMITPRVGLALVSMGNLIYAIGMQSKLKPDSSNQLNPSNSSTKFLH